MSWDTTSVKYGGTKYLVNCMLIQLQNILHIQLQWIL